MHRERVEHGQVVHRARLDDFTFIGAGEGPGDSVADHAKDELLEGFGE